MQLPRIQFVLHLLCFLLGLTSGTLLTHRSLLLGIYEGNKYTVETATYNDNVDNKLAKNLEMAGPMTEGEVRIFYHLDDGVYDNVAVTCLGVKYEEEFERNNDCLEQIRTAVAAGVRKLRKIGTQMAKVDSCGDAKAAAEGATLALYTFENFKRIKSPVLNVEAFLLSKQKDWDRGHYVASAQNIVRAWTEAPPNVVTPAYFVNQTRHIFDLVPEVIVYIRDRQWIEAQNMNAFLSVSKGSALEPFFIEIHYNNSDIVGEAPIILVGEGVTFDSGGISLKNPENMDRMRGNKAGAAQVIATIYALARLKESVNIIGLVPVCENMPGANATRPGDVVTSLNGKTIEIDNTDAAGRLVLADGLAYASATFSPLAVLTVATITGEKGSDLGCGAASVFTTSDEMWSALEEAGARTGDRVWRLPLFRYYADQVKKSAMADLNNVVAGGKGGTCFAAAFLAEFVTAQNWALLDVSGVMFNNDEVPYLGKGMTGRPTRTIIEAVPEIVRQLGARRTVKRGGPR